MLLPLIVLFITQAEGGNPGISHPLVKWKFKKRKPVRSSAMNDENKVYFGSADGSLYALQKNTGDLAWKFKTAGSTTHSPALSRSPIFLSSTDNFLYALSNNAGQLLWLPLAVHGNGIHQFMIRIWNLLTPWPCMNGSRGVFSLQEV